MKRVAIIGATEEDKAFFDESLARPSLEISYHRSLAGVDPATEIVSVFISTKIGAADLAKLPNLKLIACRSTGHDNIDSALAAHKGITVANVPSYGGTTVAEFAILLLLMLSRRMLNVLRESHHAEPNRKLEEGTDVFGKTLGVIGTGSIGLGVARIAKGLGMQVVGFDKFPRPDQAKQIGFTYVDDIDMLLKASNVITLHMPYTAANRHFLHAARLAKLKPGAIVLNTARGELIDSKALLQALHSGHIGGAGLDVVETGYEKLLAAQPNVIVTNHNAYNSTQAIERINQTTADNILHFIAGNFKEVKAI